MHKLAVLLLAPAIAAVSATVAATSGHALPKQPLARAVYQTLHVSSLQYALRVQITRRHTPIALHVRGQTNTHTISVSLQMSDLKLPDGSRVPGPNAAALVDGPFLYERAPSTLVVLGKIRWLRIPLAQLPPSAGDLRTVQSMTPRPLLRMLLEAHLRGARPHALVLHGTLAYDDPPVRAAVTKLTGGLEFHHLRVTVDVGAGGLVQWMSVTGRTADGKTALRLTAHLFGFGRPVHVAPPKPGTFMDQQLDQLQA